MLTEYPPLAHDVPPAPKAACRTAAHRRVPARVHHGVLGLLAVGVVAVACTDNPVDQTSRPTSARSAARARLRADLSGTNCGASTTIVTNEQDSLTTQYGWDARVDTVQVCETWTGSDYTTTSATVSSSDDSLVGDGTIRTAAYASGSAAAYDQSGNVIAAPAPTGGNTLFDVVLADNSQRQASYDDPYYGLGSSDGCVPTPPAVACSSSARAPSAPSGNRATAGSALAASDSAAPKFTKHGLHRRGVRALVDAGREIGPSPEGYRRFQMSRPGPPPAAGQPAPAAQQVIVSVDPKTELIMAEEATSGDATTKARHTWKQTSWGYVRDQTVVDGADRFNGQTVTSHAVITYLNVRINGLTSAPAGSGS